MRYLHPVTGVERRPLVWGDRQGREQVIAAEPRGFIYPRISPDGKRIALDALDTRLSPNGRHLYVSLAETQSEIWTAIPSPSR